MDVTNFCAHHRIKEDRVREGERKKEKRSER